MREQQIFSRYALIGKNLDIKENVNIEIDAEGKFKKITFNESEKSVHLVKNEPNYLMIPGLINSHTHIGDSFAKELGFNKNLNDVVAPPSGLKHKLLEQTPGNIKTKGMLHAALEMISNGTTFFMDFREEDAEGIRLLKETLKKSAITSLILGRYKSSDEIESVYRMADGIGLANYAGITDEIRRKLKHCKEENKKNIACHDAELRRDKIQTINMLKDEIVDVIVHGTQYSKEELIELKKENKALVLCPRSNGYFGVGFPPIVDVLKLKIPISLGTDNLMVNDTDLFEEMRYLFRIFRTLKKSNDNTELTANEMLKMITINAAKNFGIDDQIGSISEGTYANLCMLNLEAPNYYCYNYDVENLLPIIVQRTKPENIKKVYIRGELVHERI